MNAICCRLDKVTSMTWLFHTLQGHCAAAAVSSAPARRPFILGWRWGKSVGTWTHGKVHLKSISNKNKNIHRINKSIDGVFKKPEDRD